MVAWGRVVLAAAALAPVALLRGELTFAGLSLPVVLALALTQTAGPFLLIAAGEQEISSSLAGILVASTPLFTALLAIRVDHEERAEGLRLVGVALGLVGVAVLLGFDLSGGGNELLGGLAIVLASLGYAIGGFISKHRVSHLSPYAVATWMTLTSGLLLLPVAVLGAPERLPGLGPVAAVVALGVVGTGVAYAIFYALVSSVGPARTFIVTYLAPAFAVVYGAALLDERITVATIAGLALIVGGSYLALEGRLPTRRRAP